MSLRGIIAKGESVRLLPQIAAALLAAAPVPALAQTLGQTVPEAALLRPADTAAQETAALAEAEPSGAIPAPAPEIAPAAPDPRAVLPKTGEPASADPAADAAADPAPATGEPLPAEAAGLLPADAASAAATPADAAPLDADAPLPPGILPPDAASDTPAATPTDAATGTPETAAAQPPAEPADAPLATGPQLPAPDTKSRRCTIDRRSCIEVETYVADVCTTIERASAENRLDPNFLARLLWKESLFEPEAVSPVGALGIAQFMPETARIRKLDDPLNPAKAIHASADYLRYLIDGFGNMGLAAVAYNGGERRALNFYNGGTVLPYETQDYVEAITGHNAWKWRDEPPAEVDLRLDKQASFRDACIKLAGNRSLKEFGTKARSWPWGVILASHPQQSGAQKQVSQLNRQLRPILGGKRVSYVRKSLTGSGRKVYTAQVGYSSRAQANAFCTQLRAVGGRCIVLKN